MTWIRTLLTLMLLGIGSLIAADGVSWTDDFDRIGFGRWEKVPENVHIVPKDTLSAANRVLVISPPLSQQFLSSADKFIAGDVEIVFQVRKPKSGELFYYLGFHAWEPWLKSLCWVMIQNESVQFMVKTMLHLAEVPKPDDTADALAAAICHGHSAGRRDILKRIDILPR